MNPLKTLGTLGQSPWLDFLARGFIAKGELKKLVEEDGLGGVTSNPSIFEKAIAHSEEYDDDIRGSLDGGATAVGDIYEHLAIADIRAATDVLRTVYDRTKGADGFVSIEVSPYLARDTEGTLAEARRLWAEIDRPNLMVKVPGTPAGLPAIRTLLGEGININITLMFAQEVYRQVADAYLGGLEDFAAKGGDVSKLGSVASFFVSRIDVAVDKLLDDKIAAGGDKAKLEALKGKTAIANAKMAYQDYKRLFAGTRWDALTAKGARPQRLLWASTGTKNKAYSDVLYVDGLIGADTVNTMPPETMDAFRDHGVARATIEDDVAGAKQVLADLDAAGISLDQVTDKLVDEGVQKFADAFDDLLGPVAAKRAKYLGAAIDQGALALGGLKDAYDKAAETWRADGLIRKLWRRDKTLWSGADEDKWLGWLDCVEAGQAALPDYQAFAKDVKDAGFTHCLLLGMGGSSLGPEMLAQTFGRQAGYPELHIVDSTDPDQVRAAEASVDLAKTLFIVSSKSGSTTEPNVLKDYFFAQVAGVVGKDKAAGHFVAVTDPGSSLEKLAKSDGFRKIFTGDPSIGGRYSVLSPFGLVPAAAAGIDVAAMLKSANMMLRACGPDVPPAENPGVQLGLAMGVAAKAGRDKLTIVATGKARHFGAWAEQLIAESTGKNGKGLIPVDGEPLGAPAVYGKDRLFVSLAVAGEDTDETALKALGAAGHPVIRLTLASSGDIAQEIVRWEIATAVAGAVIGINPFDQPDVEASKVKTRELSTEFEKTGKLPEQTPVAADNTLAIYTDEKNAAALRKAGADGSVDGWLKAHLARAGAGDYVALLAYIARNEAHTAALQEMRDGIRDARTVATCVGFGPRFLHSTGQAYKGGPPSGVFLQITAEAPDLAVPGQKASFSVIEAAQAQGDFSVLAERDRRALRVHLKGEVNAGLAALQAAVGRAIS